MADDPRGTTMQQGEMIRVNNALVEDVACFGPTSGYMVISYSMREGNRMVSIQNVRLNVNRSTVILNTFGQNMSLCSIRPGMFVNAVFSSRMTRSIPPQSNAFLIVVQRRANEPSDVTTDRISAVDMTGSSIYTGNPNDSNDQMRFIITNRTQITDRNGRNVGIRALRPGQMVRINHASFQTASIPPQTTAFQIQIL